MDYPVVKFILMNFNTSRAAIGSNFVEVNRERECMWKHKFLPQQDTRLQLERQAKMYREALKSNRALWNNYI